MLNIAVIGGRDFNDYDLMRKVLNHHNDNLTFVNCIVSGGAKGADTLAEKYAAEISREMVVFKPDYKKYGRAAPFIRNTQIVEFADEVFAFWDGKSNGTRDAINKAKKLGKKVYVTHY